MASAGLGLLALLALSACAWGQQMNTVTDIQRPPTSCETEYDCVNKGRCIHNWPEETEKEELARMLLPDFEPSDYWPVCQCTRLPDGRMPKGPRCEDVEILDLSVRTCNSDSDCGGAKEGGRCLFREDGFGYCICLRTRTGDRCQDSVNSDRIGQQVLGYPGGNVYGGANYWGYPNMLGYQTGYGLYGNGQTYYSNSGYQPWGAYQSNQSPYYGNGYYGYYGNGARYGGAYSLGYQAPYGTTYGEASAPYNNYYHSFYNNGAQYGLGYQAPYYGSGARYGVGYQAPYYGYGAQYGVGSYQAPYYGYGAQYGVGGYQAPYYGNGAQYGVVGGYQAPYYGYGVQYGALPYGSGARYGGNYALGYQAPYSGYYGNYYQPYGYNYYRGYQPSNLSYARGYQTVYDQPYYQAAYQRPYNRGYTNYGVGYQAYPLYNYGAQLLPRTTYYQNYQLPAYQLSAYRPATFYQPYAGSSSGIPWSLYALGYSAQQPSLYQPFIGGYTGGYYPGFNPGFGSPSFNYGYNYPGYNLGNAYPGFNYGATYPGYNINYRYPGYSYGYSTRGVNLGYNYPGYNYGYGNLGSNLAYNYPRYNYGYGNLGYNLGYNYPTYNYGYAYPGYNRHFTQYPRYNYGYNLGTASPYLGYQFPGYYGQGVGYQPGLSYRALGFGRTTGVYPPYGGAAFPGYGTPYYSGYLPQPGLALSGVAPYTFYGAGYPGAVMGGAIAPGFSPVGGFGGYRPPLGFSTVPGTTGTATAPVVTTGTVRPAGVYGGVGPYAGGYGMATYGMGFGPGRILKFNKLTGTYLPTNIPYSAALGGLGGAPVGASPVPGMPGIGMALAGGGTSLVANEGKAGGWEPSLMPEMCDPNVLSGGFCQNGGICHNNLPNGVTCSCPPGWMGRACETERGAKGLQSITPYTFGCMCPIAVNGPNGQVVSPAGQPLAPGSCINPCVMTAADRFRLTNGNSMANPAFNSNSQPDLFPSPEVGPAGFLQCGDRNHPAGNCHIKPCAPGTIFSFGAQVCTTDDTGINTPMVVGGPTAAVGGPTPAVGTAFPGTLFPRFVSGVNSPAVGAIPIPYKKK